MAPFPQGMELGSTLKRDIDATLKPQTEHPMAPRPPNYNQERAERDKRGRNKKAEKLQARQDRTLQRKAEQSAAEPPLKKPDQQ